MYRVKAPNPPEPPSSKRLPSQSLLKFVKNLGYKSIDEFTVMNLYGRHIVNNDNTMLQIIDCLYKQKLIKDDDVAYKNFYLNECSLKIPKDATNIYKKIIEIVRASTPSTPSAPRTPSASSTPSTSSASRTPSASSASSTPIICGEFKKPQDIIDFVTEFQEKAQTAQKSSPGSSSTCSNNYRMHQRNSRLPPPPPQSLSSNNNSLDKGTTPLQPPSNVTISTLPPPPPKKPKKPKKKPKTTP